MQNLVVKDFPKTKTVSEHFAKKKQRCGFGNGGHPVGNKHVTVTLINTLPV